MLTTSNTIYNKPLKASETATKSLFEGHFRLSQPFRLESGETLDELTIAYTTYGQLNADGSNVVWVCHALTGNARPQEWWPGLVGTDDLFNPDEHYIVCANLIGSPYGSTHPLSVNPKSGQPWGEDFPLITVRDNVRAFELLRQYLGIDKIHTLIGGSLGGHQALEWAITCPDLMDYLIVCASSPRLTPWAVAFNQSQRLAIEADQLWPQQNSAGLKAARAIALLSYRSPACYNKSQADQFSFDRPLKAQTYQDYQGEKLVDRFDAWSYHALTRTMDTHDVGRNRGGVSAALAEIRAQTLIVGISSDHLFSVADSKHLAEAIPNARLEVIDSEYGHDGFLLETQQLSTVIQTLYEPRLHIESSSLSNIALFGFGCVGSGFYQLLNQASHNAVVTAVGVKDNKRARSISSHLISQEPLSLVRDSNIDIVVEAIDDAQAAFDIVSQALAQGKHVVSASKRMLAEHLSELIDLQRESGSTLLYEAAVAGGIPIIRQLNDYFDCAENQSIQGILNGSSNYILSRLHADPDTGYEEVLLEAQQAGFAETDPIADVGGYDAKYKAVLLALHGFGLLIKPEQVLNLGIQNITAEDIAWGQQQGFVLKQVARLDKQANGDVCITVLPEYIPADSELAQTDAENNIVIVTNHHSGYTFKGKGAGAIPTGTAVLGDVKQLKNRDNCQYRYHLSSDVALDNSADIHVYIRKKNGRIPPLNGVVVAHHEVYVILKTTVAELLQQQSYLQQNYFVAAVSAGEF
ncbi:homoserine O-acetyltransferase [Marinicella sp. W31]|uniref:homoserine dehydrogenase n=1 Tax=Marinicella sp. W31 TaxID=3023713 RepID=UPI003757A01F